MQELTDSELMVATQEEIDFYNKCIEGLPKISGLNGDGLGLNGEPIPYGSGPHILKHFKEVLEIVKPKSILEIGFNIGYGAALLLSISDAYVLSCDTAMDRIEILDATGNLRSKYKDRFEFTYRCLNSFNIAVKERQFDLCWLDGSHKEEDVIIDIMLCRELKIPYILFDDIYPRFGPGVLPAIYRFPELELIKDMENLRLYKFNKHESR